MSRKLETCGNHLKPQVPVLHFIGTGILFSCMTSFETYVTNSLHFPLSTEFHCGVKFIHQSQRNAEYCPAGYNFQKSEGSEGYDGSSWKLWSTISIREEKKNPLYNMGPHLSLVEVSLLEFFKLCKMISKPVIILMIKHQFLMHIDNVWWKTEKIII